MIGLGHYIVVAAILFTIGVLGIFLNRRNVILMLMAIELILLAVNVNLVAFSAYLCDLTGPVLALFVLTVAAAEAEALRQSHAMILRAIRLTQKYERRALIDRFPEIHPTGHTLDSRHINIAKNIGLNFWFSALLKEDW